MIGIRYSINTYPFNFILDPNNKINFNRAMQLKAFEFMTENFQNVSLHTSNKRSYMSIHEIEVENNYKLAQIMIKIPHIKHWFFPNRVTNRDLQRANQFFENSLDMNFFLPWDVSAMYHQEQIDLY